MENPSLLLLDVSQMVSRIFNALYCGLVLVWATTQAHAGGQTLPPETPRMLVLSDGYVSEYAWPKYDPGINTNDHPVYDFCVRGLMEYPQRFSRWLKGCDVKRINLDKHQGPLRFGGVDLVILDDVCQSVCDPYETAIMEYVRQGGGLLVYSGLYGLGGHEDKYLTNPYASSFQHTPLGQILPVRIKLSPSLKPIEAGASRKQVFLDQSSGQGISLSA